MSVKLGSIVVDLSANTVSFSDAMSKMSQLSATSARNVQRSLNLMSVTAGAMAASITASLAAVIDKSEEFAFSMQKMASITGTSSEMFSKLAYNAKLVGVPVDDLKGSLEKLARTSGAAQNGNKEAIETYRALGITVKDLNGPLRDSGDLTVAVAKKLDQYKDSTSKTALEQKLFGRSGAEIAPLLHQLATGFDAASNQATLFGVVVGQDTAAQAVKLHTTLEELESVALGLSLKFLTGVSPALEDLGQKVLAFTTNAEGMRNVEIVAEDVSTVIHGLGVTFEFLSQHTTAVRRTLEGFAALQVGSVFLPLISGAARAGTGIDTVGLAIARIAGRASGISQLASVFLPMARNAKDTAGVFLDLAATEGKAATGVFAIKSAFEGLQAALAANPAAVILAGVALSAWAVHGAIEEDINATRKAGDAAIEWGDAWKAATHDATGGLKGVMEVLTSFSIAGMKKGVEDYKNASTFGQRAHQNADDHTKVNKFLNAPDITPAALEPAKIDAPHLPKEGAEKVDLYTSKLKELQDAARGSAQALADVSKGLDVQRFDEDAKKAQKTIDDINESRKKQKLPMLTRAQEDSLKGPTHTIGDSEAERSFKDELLKTTEGLVAQASAQDILNAAIGKGAEAQREATLAAQKLRENAGKDPDFMKKNSDLLSRRDQANASDADSKNVGVDRQALVSVQEQISAQMKLNSAIMRGKDAQAEANLEIEQAAIIKSFQNRGDVDQGALNAALDANKQLFDLKQKQAAIDRASAMNPANAYRDEIKSIQDAVNAARELGVALDTKEILAANKAAMDGYYQSIAKVNLAVGDAGAGALVFFQEMARGSASSAQQMHDVLANAFESLNGVLTQFVTLHAHTMKEFTREIRNDFAEMFRGIGANIAKVGLQNLEQTGAKAALGALGKGNPTGTGILASLTGTKADPTTVAVQKGNSVLSQILARLTSMSGLGNGSPGSGAGYERRSKNRPQSAA